MKTVTIGFSDDDVKVMNDALLVLGLRVGTCCPIEGPIVNAFGELVGRLGRIDFDSAVKSQENAKTKKMFFVCTPDGIIISTGATAKEAKAPYSGGVNLSWGQVLETGGGLYSIEGEQHMEELAPIEATPMPAEASADYPAPPPDPVCEPTAPDAIPPATDWRAVALKAIDDEPEYPGELPLNMDKTIREAIKDHDIDLITEMLRATVRLTKQGISERITEQLPSNMW
jgi:hypothetical protein